MCDNPRTLRKRIFIICLALLFVQAAAAAQRTAPAPVGLIGITPEIKPVEARIQSPKVTQIQGVVFTTGTIDGTPVVAARSGAGKVNAAFAATLLADHFSPSAVIFTGTAGAVDSELNPGDIVIGASVGYHDFGDITAGGFVRSPTRNAASGKLDPVLFLADPALLAAARRAAAGMKPRVREGVIVTGDAFLANPARRIELRRELNASAVEMEGAAVAQICARFGIPVIVIRSITDHADGDAPGSYVKWVEPAARNAAELAVATLHELNK